MKKWIVVGLALLALVVSSGIAFAAHHLLTIEGEVEVSEAITVEPTSFSIELYPNECVTENLVVTNEGSEAITVYFTSDPAAYAPLTVDFPANILASTGDTFVTVEICAPSDVLVGMYTIDIGVGR